ncbi:hypothetical protein JHK86_052596 [Glycine max]|nr:hypothetical protein JHK86_052596 [Glycine max]
MISSDELHLITKHQNYDTYAIHASNNHNKVTQFHKLKSLLMCTAMKTLTHSLEGKVDQAVLWWIEPKMYGKRCVDYAQRSTESEHPPHLTDGKTGESERAKTSLDEESERSATPPTGESGGSTTSRAGESGGAAVSLDGESEMIIRGGDGRTSSSSGEEGGFTTGDCGSVGSSSTCASMGSGGAASLGLTNGMYMHICSWKK